MSREPLSPREMLDEVMDIDEKLNDWEREFAESIDEQMGSRGRLSEAQRSVLERIYNTKVLGKELPTPRRFR